MEEVVSNGNKKNVRNVVDDDRRAPYPEKCPECGSTKIVNNTERAEIYCGDCGIVIADNIVDLGPEWRAYDERQKKAKVRTGMPMTYRMHDMGLAVPIWSIKKLKIRTPTIQGMQQSSKEKSLSYALGRMELIASIFSLPNDIREETGNLYRKVMEEKLTRGHNIDEIIPALLYLVCKKSGNPKTFKEIAEASGVTEKRIKRTSSFLIRNKEKIGLKLIISYPWKYISGFCSKLKLSETVKTKAIEITKEVFEEGINLGQKPTTTAGVAIYIAEILCDEYRTEEETAKICGIAPLTLRNGVEKLADALKIEIPNKKQKKQLGKN